EDDSDTEDLEETAPTKEEQTVGSEAGASGSPVDAKV
nr:hypothetical protein [Tanacetum cinerariifolium]